MALRHIGTADGLVLGGLGALVFGLWEVWRPLGIIGLGIILVRIGFLVARHERPKEGV